MKPIEDRAKELSDSIPINPAYRHEVKHYLEKIAKEQKKLDDEEKKEDLARQRQEIFEKVWHFFVSSVGDKASDSYDTIKKLIME